MIEAESSNVSRLHMQRRFRAIQEVPVASCHRNDVLDLTCFLRRFAGGSLSCASERCRWHTQTSRENLRVIPAERLRSLDLSLEREVAFHCREQKTLAGGIYRI